LRPSTYIAGKDNEELIALFLSGRNGTAMDSFEGILTEEELGNIIILLRSWQE
jgi:hypothetical protein